ncbi:protein phosphatase 2C domain-containing protein [Streptomyces apocyni]|uniref:protein phosphatase 2C domain-containing protein n=1 Tax=Streptomyces apocyni TaxID=2654677 RepID=UPI0012E9F826|nr:protein phosphatase 2C domain-containing protein [Streptomyces apocyni]
MSQQGDRYSGTSGQEDDWWGQLYDDSTDDTGPAAGPDTLDDRFASAAGTLETAPPRRRPAQPHYTPPRAPWEVAGTPPAPTTFGPRPASPDRSPGGSAPGPGAGPDPDPGSGLAGAASGSRAPVVGVPAQRPAAPPPRPSVGHVGDGPPTYDPEPSTLPAAEPDALDELVTDTVLEGARYGTCTLRATSLRGDSARYRGEPRRDSLLTARFGTGEAALILVAMATGARATPDAHRAAAEACQWIGRAVGRSHERLAEDIRAARRGDLKSGLHRLTDRSLGRLRAAAAERGVPPEEFTTTSLRCLLIPAAPECRTRVFFGVGGGGLFRLRDGEWQDIEPTVAESAGEPVVGFGSTPADPAARTPATQTPAPQASAAETPEGDRLTMDLGIPALASPYEPTPEPLREPFRFRASVARPGDTLLLCTGGLAEPMRGQPELAGHLGERWWAQAPPGLAAFLADTQIRAKGYADDRTACAVWEA